MSDDERARARELDDQEFLDVLGHLEPIPLPDGFIEQTLAKARTVRRSSRTIYWKIAAATILTLTVAAGSWYWSGERSADLDLPQLIDVTLDRGSYDKGRRQAALGAIDLRMNQLAEALDRFGGWTSRIHGPLLESVTSRLPIPEDDAGAYDALRAKIESGAPLTTAEQDNVARVFMAGVYAVRTSQLEDEEIEVVARILARRFRTRIERVRPENGEGRGGKRD